MNEFNETLVQKKMDEWRAAGLFVTEYAPGDLTILTVRDGDEFVAQYSYNGLTSAYLLDRWNWRKTDVETELVAWLKLEAAVTAYLNRPPDTDESDDERGGPAQTFLPQSQERVLSRALDEMWKEVNLFHDRFKLAEQPDAIVNAAKLCLEEAEEVLAEAVYVQDHGMTARAMAEEIGDLFYVALGAGLQAGLNYRDIAEGMGKVIEKNRLKTPETTGIVDGKVQKPKLATPPSNGDGEL